MPMIPMLVAALAFQDEKAEAFTIFKKDTVWVYEETEGKRERKGRHTLKWLQEENGRISLESVSQSGDRDWDNSETMVWYLDDGCLTWGIQRKEKVRVLWKLYKIGSKKGDAWKGAGEMGEDSEATHMGAADVTIKAGEFKGAIHVQFKSPSRGTWHVYLAPKAGVLKIEREGEELYSLELQEFKDAPPPGTPDAGEPYYKFKKGSSWTYQVDDSGKAGKLVMTALEEKDGKMMIESKEYKDVNAEPKTNTMVWYVDEGCVAWGEQRTERLKPLWRIYKSGSKKGDAWKATGGEGEGVNLGIEETTVAAGTYKDAVHTQIKLKGQTIEFYLVPKVGLVRFVREDGDRKIVVELKEFSEGK